MLAGRDRLFSEDNASIQQLDDSLLADESSDSESVGGDDVKVNVTSEDQALTIYDLVDDIFNIILLHLDARSAVYLALTDKKHNRSVKHCLTEEQFDFMLKKVVLNDQRLLLNDMSAAFSYMYQCKVSILEAEQKKIPWLTKSSSKAKLGISLAFLLLMAGAAYLTMSRGIKDVIAAKEFFKRVEELDKMLVLCREAFCGNTEPPTEKWCYYDAPVVCNGYNNELKMYVFNCSQELRDEALGLESGCHQNKLANDPISASLPLLPILVFGGIACGLTIWRVLECMGRPSESIYDKVDKLNFDSLDFTLADAYLKQRKEQVKIQSESVNDMKRWLYLHGNDDFKKMAQRFHIGGNLSIKEVRGILQHVGHWSNNDVSSMSFGFFKALNLSAKAKVVKSAGENIVIPIPNEKTPLLQKK